MCCIFKYLVQKKKKKELSFQQQQISKQGFCCDFSKMINTALNCYLERVPLCIEK